MPLMNIFTGKELGPDDWSGKKTVKTGQTRSVGTTASSVGTENALPSSSDPGFLSPAPSSSKNSVSSRAGSSSDVSFSDDNSTTVVNEGRLVEPLVVSDSDEDGDTDIEGLDDYSIEGYGGCLDCNDINVDDYPEYMDLEAIDYWRRVKANRKRSLTRTAPTRVLSNVDHVTEENDNTQIEVVHDVKLKVSPRPSSVESEYLEPPKSRHFMRMVKSLSKNQKSSKQDTTPVADPTNPTARVDGRSDEGVADISANPECCEVEAQLPPKHRLSSLVKRLSKSKLVIKDTKEVAVEQSCSSSTDDRWEKLSDKYKTPDESVSSGTSIEREDRSQSQEVSYDEGYDTSNDEEDVSRDEEDLEDGSDSTESSDLEPEEAKDVVGILPGDCAGQECPTQSSKDKPRKSIWHKSVKGGAAAAARAMRSRASLVRIAKSMKFNPEALSDESRSSDGDKGAMKAKDSFLYRAKRSARFRRLGKSMKRGVSTIRKIGKQKSRSEPNLVVCIDGKGDRLGPPKRPSNRTPDNSETKSDTDPSQDHESQSGDSFESLDDVVVEVDGPVVLEMCLPGMGSHLKPLVYDDEINSICSSTQSEVRTVNTDWYFTQTHTQPGSGKGTSDKSEDGLSRLGIEAPLVANRDGYVVGGASDDCSAASGTDSDSSDSASESSQDDLNTLSTGSDDDSILYELFPVNSFSSITGIKCNDGCTKVTSKDVASSEMIRTAQMLIRGRSRVRSHGRHSNKVRVNSKSDKQTMRDGEEDSIIECIAEDSRVRSLPNKVREALFR